MARAQFAETLRILAAHDIEFIVVGMTAGVLQGVPLTTLDVDILHRRTATNIAKLLVALGKMDAHYRNDPRHLAPTESHLIGTGHQLLSTALGDLDCLGSIGDNESYDDVLEQTVTIKLSNDVSIRVLSLPKLIDSKRKAGRPKDLAALPHLEATLDELNRRAGRE